MRNEGISQGEDADNKEYQSEKEKIKSVYFHPCDT